jgi:hypothetical protein
VSYGYTSSRNNNTGSQIFSPGHNFLTLDTDIDSFSLLPNRNRGKIITVSYRIHGCYDLTMLVGIHLFMLFAVMYDT